MADDVKTVDPRLTFEVSYENGECSFCGFASRCVEIRCDPVCKEFNKGSLEYINLCKDCRRALLGELFRVGVVEMH